MDKPPLTIPRIDAQWFRSICELGPRPLVVTGWLLVWMRGHFGTDLNIADSTDPALSRNLWTPDVNTTKLVIESVTRWNSNLTERRPSIIVKRNAWKHIRLGVANRMMWTMARDLQNRYTNWWQGSHTLFCITGEGAETEKLGAEVFHELNQQADTVRRILNLRRLEVAEVGEVMKLKTDARENFVVPVNIGYLYEEAWKIVQEAPLLLQLAQELDLAQIQP